MATARPALVLQPAEVISPTDFPSRRMISLPQGKAPGSSIRNSASRFATPISRWRRSAARPMKPSPLSSCHACISPLGGPNPAGGQERGGANDPLPPPALPRVNRPRLERRLVGAELGAERAPPGLDPQPVERVVTRVADALPLEMLVGRRGHLA